MKKQYENKTEQKQQHQPKQEQEMEAAENIVIGKNPVKEILRAGREVEKILISVDDERSVGDILKLARERKIIVQRTDKRQLDRLAENGIHQGVVAMTAPYAFYELDDMMKEISTETDQPLLLILDQITDPHNYGAILRVAECCGVNGIVIGKHRSSVLSPVAIKASAGASEYVRIAKVTNISDAIRTLKKQNYWVAGADMAGDNMTQCNLTGALAVVIGNEGSGITQNVKKQCDFFISIPMKGKIASLNASVATAVVLYEAVRQRG
jgi:23S rRNA (guanosine2251-2'-O)-methyltransferase